MEMIPEIYDNDIKLIDLSADFRFQNLKLYFDTYGIEHKCPAILKNAVYGLTELNRNQMKI